MANDKKCPSCGACKECVARPRPYYAYWSVVPPYQPQWISPYQVTWSNSTNQITGTSNWNGTIS